MSDVQALKRDLLQAIDRARPDGTYDEAETDAIHARVQALLPHTALPRPFDRQEFVTGPWGTHFAQFGAKHTAGKPIVHQSDFRLLTFGNLPKAPVRLLAIEQEIHHASRDYNNVHLVENLDSTFKAKLIVYGRYRIEPAEPQRYHVEFYKVALHGGDDASAEEVRNAFGFEPSQSLAVEFKPPRLSSDVVYCDDDLRINFGSLGGVYVMYRLRHAGHSVRFGREP